jgi:hypothetical protein
VCCGFAPYFIQQSLFELRSDVLAAGLNLWGLAAMLPAWTRPADRLRVVVAGAFFTLAFATKITSLAVPFAIAAALLLSGKRAPGLQLGSVVAAGATTVLALTYSATGGRSTTGVLRCLPG